MMQEARYRLWVLFLRCFLVPRGGCAESPLLVGDSSFLPVKCKVGSIMSSLKEYPSVIIGIAKSTGDDKFLCCFCSSQSSSLHICTMCCHLLCAANSANDCFRLGICQTHGAIHLHVFFLCTILINN